MPVAIQIACPDAERLRRFMLGEIRSDDAASLGDHLLHCARCAETVHSLNATDTVVSAARASIRLPVDPDQRYVEELIARLQQLPPPTAATSPTQDLSRDDTPSDAGMADDWTTLLSPPQGPGEIGRLGGYRVLRLLGAGGMGVVFEAEDIQLKRLVALKAMKPGVGANPIQRQRFQREAQAIARLEHDHIVTIHQVGEDRGVLYLAMPLLRGETLEDRLRHEHCGDKAAPLPIAEVVRIGRQIAEGLAAAHAQGITHRDIKPANIWLEKTTHRVKILDFGLARPVEDDIHLTQSGMVAGTPAYMAPEQATGDKIDHRSDLFSLGCLLYRMTTGRLPFTGPTSIAILRSLALDQPTTPRTLDVAVPAVLSDLILRLLAKNPEQRPQTAAEVAAALQAIEHAEPAKSPHSLPRWLSLAVAAAVVIAALGVGSGFYGAAIYRFVKNKRELIVFTPATATRDSNKVSVPSASTEPFVLISEGKSPSQQFATLAEAIARAASGDTIEVHGNGPFELQPIDLGEKALTLRAAEGFWPVLSLAAEAVQKDLALLTTEAELTLEGVEFRREGDGKPGATGLKHIYSEGEALKIANCRFVLPGKASGLINAINSEGVSQLDVRNCQFLGEWHAGPVLGRAVRGSRLEVNNSIFFTAGHALGIHIDTTDTPRPRVEASSNTFATGRPPIWLAVGVQMVESQLTEQNKAAVWLERNLFPTGCLFVQYFSSSQATTEFLQREQRTLVPQLFQLESRNDRVAPSARLATLGILSSDNTVRSAEIGTMEEWSKLWKPQNPELTIAPIQFQKRLKWGNVVAESLGSNDFRLVAGLSDGTNLGADVDLVGPGRAYERFKSTPAYQRW
jgi:serine/threonine protein kinase